MVLELLHSGVPASEIAILARQTEPTLTLTAKRLKELCVPFRLSAGGGGSTGKGFLQRRIIADALAYLALVANERDDEAFRR